MIFFSVVVFSDDFILGGGPRLKVEVRRWRSDGHCPILIKESEYLDPRMISSQLQAGKNFTGNSPECNLGGGPREKVEVGG